MPTHDQRDCAAQGASTISRTSGLIDDEQRECVSCGHSCRWDLTDSSFWGFSSNCPHRIRKPKGPELKTEH